MKHSHLVRVTRLSHPKDLDFEFAFGFRLSNPNEFDFSTKTIKAGTQIL
jgi:hypothetical protein